jgi:hypothetical protein
MAIINGTDGNDTLSGASSAGTSNTVNGLAGDDLIFATDFSIVDGGEGVDTLVLNYLSSAANLIFNADGSISSIDSSSGTANIIIKNIENFQFEGQPVQRGFTRPPDYIDASATSIPVSLTTTGSGNTLIGGSGDDTLALRNSGNGSSNNLLKGGLGNDFYNLVDFGGNQMIEDAGGDNDRLQIRINFADTIGTLTKSGTTLITENPSILNFFNADGGAGTGFIENFEGFNGTSVFSITGQDILKSFLPTDPTPPPDKNPDCGGHKIPKIHRHHNKPKHSKNDKRPDILWHRNDDISLTEMDGANTSKSDVNWVLGGIKDFKGNGKTNALLPNQDGVLPLWQSDDYAETIVPIDFKSLGNADSNSDIMLYSSSVLDAIWANDGNLSAS